MAGTDFHDSRIRRRYVPLVTQQYRLRHIRCLAGRNLQVDPDQISGLYFTLHLQNDSAPYYTSLVIKPTRDPSWPCFEEVNKFETVQKSTSYLIVKVWSIAIGGEINCFLEFLIHMNGLAFLGEQVLVPKEGKMFRPNSILVGMTEGFYGPKDCLKGYQPIKPASSLFVDHHSIRTSYNINTLIRFKTMETAISQTESSARKLRDKISNRLMEKDREQKLKSEVMFRRLKVNTLRNELYSQAHTLATLTIKNDEKKKYLAEEKASLQKRILLNMEEKDQLNQMRSVYIEEREKYLKSTLQLQMRRKKLITELSHIYPIKEMPDKKGYTICQVHLPNSEEFLGHDEIKLSVAVGYVCHLVMMLSYFLNLPLRYNIQHNGSRSTIYDHINPEIPSKSRELPLFAKGKDRTHFEYGVYLLNKNIAQLRQQCGLQTPDLRNTLFNLHHLIEVRFNLNGDQLNISAAQSIPSGRDSTYSYNPQFQEERSLSRISSTYSGIHAGTDSADESIHNHMVAALMQSETPNQSGNIQMFSRLQNNTLSCSIDNGLNSLHQSRSNEKGVLDSDGRFMPAKLRQNQSHGSVPNLSIMKPVDLVSSDGGKKRNDSGDDLSRQTDRQQIPLIETTPAPAVWNENSTVLNNTTSCHSPIVPSPPRPILNSVEPTYTNGNIEHS